MTSEEYLEKLLQLEMQIHKDRLAIENLTQMVLSYRNHLDEVMKARNALVKEKMEELLKEGR